MNRIVQAATVITIVLIQCNSVFAEWTNSLKPKGEPAGEFVIVNNGATAASIRIAADGTQLERKAGEELRHWVEQISGVALEISTDDKGPAIVLRSAADPGHEGYRISIDGDDLVLEGGTGRGMMNAVYALLEEDLGCRFYTNESIRLPRTKTLRVAPVARSYTPQLKLRDPYYRVAWDATWSLRNRTNAPTAPVGEEQGGRVDYAGLFVHTHAALLPPGEYFATHPEYYALNAAGQRYANQLCATDPEWPNW